MQVSVLKLQCMAFAALCHIASIPRLDAAQPL